MEDVLLRDLQGVLVREAEGAVVREEVAALCQLQWEVGLDTTFRDRMARSRVGRTVVAAS